MVFDLDGVLVDVEESYRRAIKDTVEEVHGIEVEDKSIQALKNAGGFNNDWHVTYALALLGLIERNVELFNRHEWFRNIKETGGGLETAITNAGDQVRNSVFDDVLDQWDRSRMLSVFQQLYLGSELYEEIEGEAPDRIESGYIYDERVLLDVETRRSLLDRYSIAVLTGRPRAEAKIALERVGLNLPSGRLCAMEDWEASKPHPSGLFNLREKLEADSLVLVGDTLDDIRTAVSASEKDPDRSYYGVGVLTGGLKGNEGMKKFKEAGAHVVLESVNELPELLS